MVACEQYQLSSPEQELLMTRFKPATKENANAFMNASQIAVKLSEIAKITITDGTINRLGKALKKHAFIRMAKNKSYVYAVKQLDYSEVETRAKEKENTSKETPAQLKFRSDFQTKKIKSAS